jgi:hypothetical protein
MEDEEDGIGGLTIDDTSEFVRSITFAPVTVKTEPTEPQLGAPASAPAPVKRETASNDVEMDTGDVALTELEAGEVVVKEEEEEEDEGAMLNALEVAMKEAEADEVDNAGDAGQELGTAAEQSFGTGMASTLSILRNQGLIAGSAADSAEREQIQRQRDLWLASQRRRVAERELERVRSRGQNKDQAQREYENRQREAQEARETLEAFREYKPDVDIKYFDEFGRTLTPKEAWKALSHKFHGKGSGRMKTEKRLKKIAEEKKAESMASGDTPLSMQQAFQRRQEQAGQAHMVLSVGNRGYVTSGFYFDDDVLMYLAGLCHKRKSSSMLIFCRRARSRLERRRRKRRRHKPKGRSAMIRSSRCRNRCLRRSRITLARMRHRRRHVLGSDGSTRMIRMRRGVWVRMSGRKLRLGSQGSARRRESRAVPRRRREGEHSEGFTLRAARRYIVAQ